jgi:hypothetical protein
MFEIKFKGDEYPKILDIEAVAVAPISVARAKGPIHGREERDPAIRAMVLAGLEIIPCVYSSPA